MHRFKRISFRRFLLNQRFPLPWHRTCTVEIVSKVFSYAFGYSFWVVSMFLWRQRLKYAGIDFLSPTAFYYAIPINIVGKSWMCINISVPSAKHVMKSNSYKINFCSFIWSLINFWIKILNALTITIKCIYYNVTIMW